MLLSNNSLYFWLAALGIVSPYFLPSALVSTQMEVTAVLCQIIVGVMVNIGPPVVIVVCYLLFVVTPSLRVTCSSALGNFAALETFLSSVCGNLKPSLSTSSHDLSN